MATVSFGSVLRCWFFSADRDEVVDGL